jgi:hypothetical protein
VNLSTISALLTVALTVLATPGCGGGARGTATDAGDIEGRGDGSVTVDVHNAEKRCGEPGKYFSAYNAEQVAMLSDCTVLVGRFQQDSVSALEDFSGLEKVRKIEGMLNVFRSGGFRTLRGLDNLEVIEGTLSIHQNWNLTSISALGKLHTITGDLFINDNDKLSQAEVDAFAARVAVGGSKMVRPTVAP